MSSAWYDTQAVPLQLELLVLSILLWKNYMVIAFNFYTDLASFIAELIILKLTFRGMISEWFFLILQLAPISVY